MTNTGIRIARLEHEVNPPPAINPPRVDITVNVQPPSEPTRERGGDGAPTLTADERAAVEAGDTLCFVYIDEPRHVSFNPDGRGGITVNTTG